MQTMCEEFMGKCLNGEQPKSNETIYKMAYHDWVNVLTQLWSAIGKPVNDKQLKVYIKQLSDVPMGTLDAIVATVLKEHKYNTVPMLAEIWAVMKRDFDGLEQAKATTGNTVWAWRLMGDDKIPRIL